MHDGRWGPRLPVLDVSSGIHATRVVSVISRPGSSVEDIGIHRNTQTTSPLRRPEEVVLAVSDGSLDASERTAE